MASSTRRTSFCFSILVAISALAVIAFSLTACYDEESLKGGLNEACDIDSENDCRADLECVDYVCTFPGGDNGVGEQECETICDRLDECDAPLENCIIQCRSTVAEWGEGPLQSFTQCFTDDHDCDQLRDTDDPPQMCYNELDLPSDREALCDEFVLVAESCGSSGDSIDSLYNECRFTARTSGPDDWADVEACDVGSEPRDCPNQIDCLNETLDVDPALDTLDNDFSGGDDPRNDRNDEVDPG